MFTFLGVPGVKTDLKVGADVNICYKFVINTPGETAGASQQQKDSAHPLK